MLPIMHGQFEQKRVVLGRIAITVAFKILALLKRVGGSDQNHDFLVDLTTCEFPPKVIIHSKIWWFAAFIESHLL